MTWEGLTELGSKNDGAGGAELHGETARGRVERQTVTEVTHDVVAVCPDTNGDANASVDAETLLEFFSSWVELDGIIASLGSRC